MTADQMPDELYVFTSQQGERITYHASTDSDTCGTLYTRQHPTPAQAQGERAKALAEFTRMIEADIGDLDNSWMTAKSIEVVKAALSHAPEVVTVEEFARGMVIAIASDLTPKEIAESLQKNYPHGLTIIKRTE